jgi:cellulose synthase/poly-beta-1,6-N-acetylglucosamine synthase-like glycosyltransferase
MKSLDDDPGTVRAPSGGCMNDTPSRTASPEVSVVLAVGNDEETVGHQIRSVAGHLGRLGRSFEILAVNDGSSDNSLSIVTILAASMPEVRVLSRNVTGRAFLRGTSEARGAIVVLLTAGRAVSFAPLGWALSRLAGGREAVILRGRYIVARRLMVLPVIVRASGPGLFFEAVFERRAQELGIDVVGSRPKQPTPFLLRPVLRFLAA